MTHVLIALLTLTPFLQDGTEKPVPIKVVEKWIGVDSKSGRTDHRRIADTAAWRAFWADHAGREAKVPTVDFGKNMVVALQAHFLDHVRLEYREVVESKSAIQVVFGETGPQVEYDPQQKRHTTYVIVVVPKSTKAVEFVREHHEGELKDARIVRTLAKRLDPVK